MGCFLIESTYELTIHLKCSLLLWTTIDQLKCNGDVVFKNVTARTCGSPWLRQIGVGQREEWNPNFFTLSQHVESFKVKWGMKGHWHHSTHYPHTPGAHHTGLMAADRAALEWEDPSHTDNQKFCMFCMSCVDYYQYPEFQLMST